METASTVILDALKEIVAHPSEAAIDAYKAQVGIFYLNAMMLDFSVNGINLGYTVVSSLSDAITVDDAAIEPIVKNLAIEISPVFKSTPTSQELFQQAQDGYESLLNIGFEGVTATIYPYTLPTGSGNYNWGSDKFYDELGEPILTELGQDVAYEG